MFGINQLQVTNPKPQSGTVSGVSAGVSVSTGLLTLVVIGGIAYLVLRK